jgi:AraC-like DNA-binding protein
MYLEGIPKERNMKRQRLFPSPIIVERERAPKQDIHWHEDPEIIVVLKGSLSLQISFEKFILDEGDIMIVNSLESHKMAAIKGDTETLFITMDWQRCLQIEPYFYESLAIADYSVGFAEIQENRDRVMRAILLLLKALPHDRWNKGVSRQTLDKLLDALANVLETFGAVYRPKIQRGDGLVEAPEKKVRMMYRMIHYLYDNYNKSPSLEDYVKTEHYSLYHVSHVIVEITGTSFRDWLTYVRVEQAEKLLLSTDLPINDIARQVGFSSSRYFNSNFFKWYGTAPSSFRRLFQSKYEGSDEAARIDLMAIKSLLDHEHKI